MFNYLYFKSLSSTNDTAKTYPPYTVIHAGDQTNGRGRMGRTWTSLQGNLFMSIVIPFDKDAFYYSFISSLAVAMSLSKLSPRIKWPNDVLIDGKKISGILLETSEDSSRNLIIGIGVNIKSSPLQALYQTTCLKDLGINATPKNILDEILKNFEYLLELYKRLGFKEIRRRWLEFAIGQGKQIHVRLPHEELIGIFQEIDNNGALILRTETSYRTITAGDIFII